jgi:hypothetical protein
MSLREATADERAEFENSAADEEDDEDGALPCFLWTSPIQMPKTAPMSECHEAAVATYDGECVDGRSA